MKNDLDITVNGPRGVVILTLNRRNGIDLPTPQVMEVPIDNFVLTALKIVEHGIHERSVPVKIASANGFKI